MRFELLGDPVRHSLSPPMHRAAFADLGVDASYDVRRVSGGDLEAAMRGVTGGNVTLPHKPRAAEALDLPGEDVLATGACNCFWTTPEGRLAGDNTDVTGCAAGMAEAGLQLAGARVLLLGAGGAARAVALTLTRGGARSIETLNRTPGRAHALATALGLAPLSVLEEAPAGPYDLAVNATSLGLDASDPLPLDLGQVEVGAVYDLVYGLGGTPWTRRARELGIPATDGLGMLVHQAARSLRHWVPGRRAPLDAMRAAAEASLRARAEDLARAPAEDVVRAPETS